MLNELHGGAVSHRHYLLLSFHHGLSYCYDFHIMPAPVDDTKQRCDPSVCLCHPPTPRGTWRNFGETRGRVGKWRAGAQKRQYLWNALRQRKSYHRGPIRSPNTLSNGTICDPLRSPLPLDQGSQPQPKFQSLLSQESWDNSNWSFGWGLWKAKAMHFKFSMDIQKLSGHSYIRRIAQSSLR